jgi:uncharacterized protein YbbC (DUF1343 family)
MKSLNWCAVAIVTSILHAAIVHGANAAGHPIASDISPGVRLGASTSTPAAPDGPETVACPGRVRTGLDVMEAEGFSALRGKRVGMITNQTGVDCAGRRNIDVMRAAGVDIVVLFTPEHGLAGTIEGGDAQGAIDPSSRIPVYSLYGANRLRPDPKTLKDLDALVFDVADVGTRFYTYATTMAYCMEAAARARVGFYVLDRPNPITGSRVEGPMLDMGNLSFVGFYPIALRHGMTIGELARLFNTETRIGADLHVVAMSGWRRGDWFDQTGLPWINPSPNLRRLDEAILYPGVAMLEGSPGYSVGRGTDRPFELIGAAFIDGRRLAAALDVRAIPGVAVAPAKFKPDSGPLAGREVEGVAITVTDRERFDSTRFGLELAATLDGLYPGKLDFVADRLLIGSDAVLDALRRRAPLNEIMKRRGRGLEHFREVRRKYLLYR